MKKLIRDLKQGDIWKDSFGYPLEVEKTEQLSGITEMTRVYFVTQDGKRMYQSFKSDRQVEVIL